MEAAFQQLKQALLEAPILAYPQFNTDEPFILDTDWSKDNNCIGPKMDWKESYCTEPRS